MRSEIGMLISACRTAAAVLRTRGTIADAELATFLECAAARVQMHQAPAVLRSLNDPPSRLGLRAWAGAAVTGGAGQIFGGLAR